MSEVKFSEDQINSIIAEARDQIVLGAVESVKRKVSETIQYHFSEQIREEVAKYVAEFVVPEVGKALAENKTAIISGIVSGAVEIGQMVSKSMIEAAAKNLTNDWRSKSILKEIFQ